MWQNADKDVWIENHRNVRGYYEEKKDRCVPNNPRMV